MITVKLEGTKAPSKAKAPDDNALWKKTDPIWLLRQCLGNKLRSTHWRSAHNAKKKWLNAYKANVQIMGEPVKPPAFVIIEHSFPRSPDIDAPIKVLLDALQEDILTSKDDKDIHCLLISRKKPDPNPAVYITAVSLSEEPFLAHRLAAEHIYTVQLPFLEEQKGSSDVLEKKEEANVHPNLLGDGQAD